MHNSCLIILILTILFSGCTKEQKGEKFPPLKNAEQVDRMPEAIPESDDNSYPESEGFQQLVKKYEDPDRRNWQNPELIMDKLGPLEGKTVADIGAGTGYFAFQIARQASKVIAIDIDERFIEYIEERKAGYANGIADNIVTRLTSKDNPSLSRQEADIVLLVNTYPFINKRPAYFKEVKDGIKEDGFLMIVDYKKGNMPVGPPDEIKLAPEKVFAELRKAGFKEFNIDENSLQYQYIIMAK